MLPYVAPASQKKHPIKGVLAATLTPLTDDGEQLDEGAFGPLVDFLADARLDGVLALGTTGEGILLDMSERRRATELFQTAARGRLKVVAHCGAQSTRDTVALAAHAANAGVAGVAVIGPPYFLLDDRSILEHFAAAARACAPLPFYIYEFAARSGYSVPLHVIEELRGMVDNLAGLKGFRRAVGEFPALPSGRAGNLRRTRATHLEGAGGRGGGSCLRPGLSPPGIGD